MASVRIEAEAFGDDRYEDLAVAAGLIDADHARGKMARLWRQCTIEQTHALPEHTVVRWLGANGVDALVRSRLGERIADTGMVRIRGTHGRIEWLKKLRNNGKFGKRGGRPKKNPQGFQDAKPGGFARETPLTPAPALTPALLPEENKPDGPARARDPVVPSTDPAPTQDSPKLAEVKRKVDRAERKARERPMPPDWEPTDKHRELANELGVSCPHEAAKFGDHHRARGSRFVDWDAAFRTWLRNAVEFSRGRAPPRAPQETAIDAAMRLVREAELDERKAGGM